MFKKRSSRIGPDVQLLKELALARIFIGYILSGFYALEIPPKIST